MDHSIIFTILMITSLVYTLPVDDSNENYVVMFDAGSKNTRMHIYNYKNSDNFVNFKITQLEFYELKDGGLSNYKTKEDVETKFSSSMDRANLIIPSNEKSRTKIYLAATAGMRLLEIKNKTHSDMVMKFVRNYFKKSGYNFENDNQVRIISGQEEGDFAWISTNFLSKKLGNNEKTLGVLEVGGSSGQIAFVANNVQVLNPLLEKHFSNYKFNRVNYKLYSHSFLCFGTNQIANMYNSFRLKSEQYSRTFKASCYPDGTSEELLGEDLINLPCVNGDMFENSSYAFIIDKERIKNDDKILIKGNSKKNKCRDEIEALIPTSNCSNYKCSIDNIFMPPVDGVNFIALGNIHDSIVNTEKLLKKKIENDINEFDQATYKICSMTYSELKDIEKLNNAGISNKKLKKLCLENVYVLKLIEIYGFDSLRNINAVEMINNQIINWSHGFIINEVLNHNNNETNKISSLFDFWSYIINLINF